MLHHCLLFTVCWVRECPVDDIDHAQSGPDAQRRGQGFSASSIRKQPVPNQSCFQPVPAQTKEPHQCRYHWWWQLTLPSRYVMIMHCVGLSSSFQHYIRTRHLELDLSFIAYMMGFFFTEICNFPNLTTLCYQVNVQEGWNKRHGYYMTHIIRDTTLNKDFELIPINARGRLFDSKEYIGM